jgi:hypothetical protein
MYPIPEWTLSLIIPNPIHFLIYFTEKQYWTAKKFFYSTPLHEEINNLKKFNPRYGIYASQPPTAEGLT